MFWLVISGVYLVLGVMTSVATVLVFPPLEGYRPSLGTVISAAVVFTLLWPILVGLAVWYSLTRLMDRAESKNDGHDGPRLNTGKPR